MKRDPIESLLEGRNMSDEKVVVIGIDGATFDLIRPWAEKGKLPTFQRMLAEGASCILLSTIPPSSPPAWTTFMTGMNPGKHGIFNFTRRVPESYKRMSVNSSFRSGKTIWNLLDEMNRNSIVVNVPFTCPPDKINGLMIAGHPAQEYKSRRELDKVAFPVDRYKELEQEIGGYEIHLNPLLYRVEEATDLLLGEAQRMLEKRVKAVTTLMKRDRWDLFVVVFTVIDALQHFFWNYMDKTHPRYDPNQAERYSNTILLFYQRIDEAMSRIIDALESDTTVFVVSDHGFGPKVREFYVNAWLAKLGLLHIRKRLTFRKIMASLGLVRKNVKWALPLGLYRIINFLPRQVLRNIPVSKFSLSDCDWSSTKAYGDYDGMVYINLRGREPKGIVEKGEEYGQLRKLLIDELVRLRDPETGEQVVTRVYTKEELYHGPHFEDAPDLVFLMDGIDCRPYIPDDLRVFSEICDPAFDPDSRWSGMHKQQGICLCWGKHANKGHYGTAKIEDLAPTVLYLLGMPIPRNIDGEVLTHILDSRFVSSNPIRYQGAFEEESRVKSIWSEKDDEAIKERLRALGYLD